jgi:hypothetical protein
MQLGRSFPGGKSSRLSWPTSHQCSGHQSLVDRLLQARSPGNVGLRDCQGLVPRHKDERYTAGQRGSALGVSGGLVVLANCNEEHVSSRQLPAFDVYLVRACVLVHVVRSVSGRHVWLTTATKVAPETDVQAVFADHRRGLSLSTCTKRRRTLRVSEFSAFGTLALKSSTLWHRFAVQTFPILGRALNAPLGRRHGATLPRK